MADRDIAVSTEHPEASVDHIVRGIVRRGLKPVPSKTSISLRLGADVLEWLKSQGPGRGQDLAVHGWVYGLEDGLVRDLGTTVTDPAKVAGAYRAALASM
jgi:hypothetical protein